MTDRDDTLLAAARSGVVTPLHERPWVRDALLPRAAALAVAHAEETQRLCTAANGAHCVVNLHHPWVVAGYVRNLASDLDTLTRLLAVRLGLWDEPWPEGESAPRLLFIGGIWSLCFMEWRDHMFLRQGFPGLAYTSQSRAIDAARCILDALEDR